MTNKSNVCPRCKIMPLEKETVHNALSRRDNKTYICSACGNEEAFIDAGIIPNNEVDKAFCRKLKRAKRTPKKDRPEYQQYRKTRPIDNPYEIWQTADGQWEWRVLKKWQVDDDKPFARWFCAVTSPFVAPGYEYGDVYVQEIKSVARLVKVKK